MIVLSNSVVFPFSALGQGDIYRHRIIDGRILVASTLGLFEKAISHAGEFLSQYIGRRYVSFPHHLRDQCTLSHVE